MKLILLAAALGLTLVGCEEEDKFNCDDFCDIYIECLTPSMVGDSYPDEKLAECDDKCSSVWNENPNGPQLIQDCELDECEEFLDCSENFIDWE